ncbi:MAG: DUF192 domain-containing protein [Limnobacter sp.]|nr:DUF192 domain-containing protein [Limnobacter sp.]
MSHRHQAAAYAVACLLFGLLAPLPACADSTPPTTRQSAQNTFFGESTVRLGKHTLKVEVANTPQARNQGLMFRTSLPDNQGMLFKFDQAGEHCMWMQNTLIDLDVAFFNAQGRLINIEAMQAGTVQIHCAKSPALYALEMNRGWFDANHVKSGTQLHVQTPEK